MIPGLTRSGNVALLWVFALVIALPIIMGQTRQPYLGCYHVFLGGMIGSAWGRGVHASLHWQDYAFAALVLGVIEWLYVIHGFHL